MKSLRVLSAALAVAAFGLGCQGNASVEPAPEAEIAPAAETEPEPEARRYELRLRGKNGGAHSAFLVGVSDVAIAVDGEPQTLKPDATSVDLAVVDHAYLITQFSVKPGARKVSIELRFDEYGAMERGGVGSYFRSSAVPLRWEATVAYLEQRKRAVVELELESSVSTLPTGEAWLLPRTKVAY